jgi:hypothetical protein
MHLLPSRVLYTAPQESREELRDQFGYRVDDYIGGRMLAGLR